MEKDDRNRSRGKPRELDISIRDPIYGQLNPLPDGTYEMNISVSVLVNGRPGYGFFYQFVVDALPQGNRQLLTEGKASATIRVSGKRPSIAVEIGNDRNPYKRYPIRDFEIAEFLSKDKGGKKSPKISIISQMANDKSYSVVLALVDEDGKCVSGNINYLDADPGKANPKPQLHSPTVEEKKSLSIDFTLGKEGRKVIVFLQDDPAEKVTVEIPAMPEEKGGKKLPKIQIVSQLAKGKGFCVVVALVDESGKCVSGNIGYIDADPDEEDPEPRLHTETTEENKSLSITFVRNKESRKVAFFLPENPAEKKEVEISALPEEEGTSEEKKLAEEVKLAELRKKKAQAEKELADITKDDKSSEEKDLAKEVKLAELRKNKAQFEKDMAGILKEKTQAEKEEQKPPKIPTDLKVYAHPQGPAKEYFISIEVWGEDKVGISGVTLEIKDIANPAAAQRQQVVKTVDGAHRFKVKASGPREIFISVVGNPLDYTLNLPGPDEAEYLPPPEVPQAPRKVLQRGFWATMKWYRDRVIEARERR